MVPLYVSGRAEAGISQTRGEYDGKTIDGMSYECDAFVCMLCRIRLARQNPLITFHIRYTHRWDMYHTPKKNARQTHNNTERSRSKANKRKTEKKKKKKQHKQNMHFHVRIHVDDIVLISNMHFEFLLFQEMDFISRSHFVSMPLVNSYYDIVWLWSIVVAIIVECAKHDAETQSQTYTQCTWLALCCPLLSPHKGITKMICTIKRVNLLRVA